MRQTILELNNSSKEVNNFTMNVLSDLRSAIDAVDIRPDSQVQCAALNRAIEAIYQQNKLIDMLDNIKSKDCFVTDNKGVAVLLSSLLVGNSKYNSEGGEV